LPHDASERINELVSDLSSCKGIPDEVLQELKESRGKIYIGGRSKVIGGEGRSILNLVLTIQNRNICSWGSCMTHFFKENPNRDICEYVFSARVFKDINPTSSFIMSEDDKYHSDCEVFFNGVCSIEENVPWLLYVH
jgi:hypothetical protein